MCFLDGHGEPDPFSLESHDHLEGAPGHTHGLGAKYVLHERHGMAKARHALETLNYKVRDGETHKVPYLAVVGQREAESGGVAVRVRGSEKKQVGMSVEEFVKQLVGEVQSRALKSEIR